MKPERHTSMSFDAYRDMDGLNFSLAKDAWKTPRSFRAAERVTQVATDAMREGSLIHSMVLEPGALREEYVKGPDCRRGTKEWKSFEDTKSRGRKIVKPDEWSNAERVADAVRSNADALQLLDPDGGEVEVVYTWTDEETGLILKSRIDIVRDGVIVDLKTTTDASGHTMSRRLVTSPFYYLAQLAWYQMAYHSFHGEYPSAHIIAAEKSIGNPVAVYDIDEAELEYERNRIRELLNLIVRIRMDEVDTEHYSRRVLLAPDWHFQKESKL